jgi:CheY-like chemotaxis protein
MNLSPADRPKDKRVLLVDDNELIRRLRATILGNLGHDVTQAETLEEAKNAWAPGRFHLVIVDLKNHVDEAMEFCDDLKKKWPDQLVAFLTPPTTDIEPNSCPDEVIPKEEGPAQFVRQVKELLAT